MTVNNSANKVIAAGNGVQTVFGFAFIAVQASDLAVILMDASGNETTLAPANYTVALNPTPPGQIWSIGGTVTYPLSGSPIPMGSTLTIVRQLSLTQLVALGNQGNEFPSAVESAIDLIEMQLQQVNELFQRAIVAPVVDPAAPLPLPPVAQRANRGMGFDANGNPVAIATPASGVISSAMQSVVNAATLALGRQAFGLGNIATQNIGAGLLDDGAGGVRVNNPITQVATSQVVDATFDLQRFLTTGPINFTIPRVETLFNGFGFWIDNTSVGAVALIIDSHDTIQGYASGQSVNVPPNTSVFIATDAAAAGNILIDWGLATAPPMASGGFTGLVVANNAANPNDHIDVTATEITLPNLLAGAVKHTNVAFTINGATIGLNGMDVGTLPTSGWIYIYAVSNGSVIGGLASLSSSGPTMPVGFTFRKRLGAMRTDSSAHLLRTRQLGIRAAYTPVTGSNTTGLPQISNFTGSVPAAWTAETISNFVPPTAAQIKVTLFSQMNASQTGSVGVVPNNNYSTSFPGLFPIEFGASLPTSTSVNQSQTAELNLEGAAIYLGGSGSVGQVILAAYGWTDNL